MKSTPLDIPAAAIAALAAVPLPPDRRLIEVAALAMAMNGHATSYRAAEVEEEEVEDGVRRIGQAFASNLRRALVTDERNVA